MKDGFIAYKISNIYKYFSFSHSKIIINIKFYFQCLINNLLYIFKKYLVFFA